METTNENIRQLLEMLDNPDAYTEQQIQDIINRDEDTRETYRLMVEAKRSSRHRQHQKTVDVDAAWQRFNKKLQPKQQGFGWMKIAASFIGVLLVSGIAFAAIHIASHNNAPKEQDEDITNSQPSTSRSQFAESDTIPLQPRLYDNVPLGEIFEELSGFYNVKVVYQNEDAPRLRLFYQWKPEYTLEKVVEMLNNFEWIQIQAENDTLFIRTTAIPAKDC